MKVSRTRWSRGDWAVVVAYIVCIAAARAGTQTETDPYWQIRAGIENLNGLPLARPDSWSWAPVDAIFFQNSPGWNDALAVGWRIAGFHGLFALTALSIGVFLGMVVLLCLQLRVRAMPTLIALLVVSILGFSGFSGRGTLPAQSLLLATVALGYFWSARLRRLPTLITAILLFACAFTLAWVGVWVHSSWLLLALAAAVAWWVLFWFAPRIRRTQIIFFGALSSLGFIMGSLSGPYGLTAWRQSSSTYETSHGLVSEWMGLLGLPLQWSWWAICLGIWIVCTLAAVWTWNHRNSRRSVREFRLILALVMLGGVLSLGALWAVRFILISLFVLAPLLAFLVQLALDRRNLTPAVGTRPNSMLSSRIRAYSYEPFIRVVFLGVLLLLLPGVTALTIPLARPAAADVEGMLPKDCRLFGHHARVNPLLLLRPDIHQWWDGRFDYYGRARMLEGLRYAAGQMPTLVPRGTTCVVTPSPKSDPDVSSFVTAMDASAQWRRVFSDDRTIAWVMTQTFPSPG